MSNGLHLRSLAGTVLFLGVSGGAVYSFGLGVEAIAIALFAGVAFAQFLLSGVYGSGHGATADDDLPAGGTECPHCGSVKTDLERRFGEEGDEIRQLHCFECERDISHDAVGESTPEELCAAGDLDDVRPSGVKIFAGVFAFLAVSGGLLYWFGPRRRVLAILVLAGIALSQIGLLGGGSDEPSEDLPTPGSECPHCGSAKTDLERRIGEEGREFQQLHCIDCERDIPHALATQSAPES